MLQDDVTLGLIVLNIILTVLLLAIYYKNYRAVKSKLALGLMFFIFAFLLENLLDFFFYNSLVMQSVFGFTTSYFVVNALEMIGLLILLYITWK
jgi:hypothetical protein